MRWTRLLLPLAATVATTAVILPTQLVAFGGLPDMLDLDQRSVRVFNNFTNPEANNNTTPDPDFPGYVGAELAIWKAAVEWGSALHGDGGGDPVEGLLGSGSSNFDFTWQGNAPDVGGLADNTCSMLSGSLQNVLSFTEGNVNGWRIRFYESGSVGSWIWQDGPGDEELSSVIRPDLQGMAALQLGFALGLSASQTPGNTMYPLSQGNTIERRSIELEDVTNLQAIYGVAAAGKPVITKASRFAQGFLVEGANFSPTDNEVWFTRGDGLGDGTPVKVVGLVSTLGGTRIEGSLPAEAGSGDVLVKVPGTSGSDLSNAWPFDRDQLRGFPEFCNVSDNTTFFCPCANIGNGLGGCDNAQGTGGVTTQVQLFFPTTPQATLICSGYPTMGSPTSILIRGTSLLSNAAIFGDGLRCVDTPVVRLAAEFATGGVSTHTFGHGAGTGTFHYQPWYRNTPQSYCDPAAAFNLGSGVSIAWP